jgi:hypothetical protein
MAELSSQGYFLTRIPLPPAIGAAVTTRDWAGLDRLLQLETRPGGAIFEALRPHAKFSEIEFIISIRSSIEAPDEDGIWHDDGSRVLAFSLSLTPDPGAIEGGKLEIRRRLVDPPPESAVIPTPDFGTMIVFATGQGGYEHKINRVSRGERIIIAGWCT